MVKVDVAASPIASVSSACPAQEVSGKRHPLLIVLTKQQAIDIYSMRSPETTRDPALKAVAGKSSMVAEMYGVAPKTIRDNWHRKTWIAATRPYWTKQEQEEYELEQAQAKLPPAARKALQAQKICTKRRGRPPGSKDCRPRRKKIKGEDGDDHIPSEGLMYVTIDGAVEVRPIPQAPPVDDEPPRRQIASASTVHNNKHPSSRSAALSRLAELSQHTTTEDRSETTETNYSLECGAPLKQEEQNDDLAPEEVHIMDFDELLVTDNPSLEESLQVCQGPASLDDEACLRSRRSSVFMEDSFMEQNFLSLKEDASDDLPPGLAEVSQSRVPPSGACEDEHFDLLSMMAEANTSPEDSDHILDWVA